MVTGDKGYIEIGRTPDRRWVASQRVNKELEQVVLFFALLGCKENHYWPPMNRQGHKERAWVYQERLTSFVKTKQLKYGVRSVT